MEPGLKDEYQTIDEYIRNFPAEVQIILRKMRQTIREAAPEATEAISYRMPTFKLAGANLVHFAAHTRHLGFYPTPAGIKAFKDELSHFESAKGSVQFPFNKVIPFELVRRIVLFRVEEVLHKQNASKR
jgi:uncharacterized protein YdhG (YjbR/CyaY superfamily)